MGLIRGLSYSETCAGLASASLAPHPLLVSLSQTSQAALYGPQIRPFLVRQSLELGEDFKILVTLHWVLNY